MSKTKLKGSLRVTLALTISVSVSVPTLWVACGPWSSQTPVAAQDRGITHCAPTGEHSTVTLDDSSLVELNSRTCITVRYSGTTRLISLDSGEAVFSVAHDPLRPFIVESGHLRVQALGTKFKVYKRKIDTRVSVFEGEVQVSVLDSMSPRSLPALQELDVPDDSTHNSVLRHITAEDIDRMTAWDKGYIVFEAQTVDDIMTELARYADFTLDIADPAIMRQRFSATFRTTDVVGDLVMLKTQCIHAEYDPLKQIIRLSWIPGKRGAAACFEL